MPAGQQLDAPGPAARPRRTLPPEALAGLRSAFAAELAERMPRLTSLHPDSDGAHQQQARRDAHNLASSAVVVGQVAAGRVARAIEDSLERGALDEVGPQVAALVELLDGWDA